MRQQELGSVPVSVCLMVVECNHPLAAPTYAWWDGYASMLTLHNDHKSIRALVHIFTIVFSS